MFGLPKQVQQALAFLLLILVFGGGIAYGRWDKSSPAGTTFQLEKNIEKNNQIDQEPETLKVHVAGAVRRPGVYTLKSKERVEDALALAEPLLEADLDSINLANYLKDEQRIFVPFQQSYQEGMAKTSSQGSGGSNGKININLATKDELQKLPGIGPALAQRILDYREAHGFFGSIEELKQVSGIGDKKFQDLENSVIN